MKNNRILLMMLVPLLTLVTLAVAQTRKAQPPKSLRLYVFDGGSLNIPDTSPYQLKKEQLATSMMSVPCFLIAHPRGTLIWDTGAVPDSNFKPGGGPATLRYATTAKPLAEQLASIGYGPGDITYWRCRTFTGIT
jgi:N-acyl homoserine lactone hydrolase